MRVLVTGSRDWDDPDEVWLQLDRVTDKARSSVVLIHGACPTGADAIADMWARTRGVPREVHPADWETHGKAAGFIRNRRMVQDGADLCLAFLRNQSKGTRHTMALARTAGIPVEVFEVNDDQG